MPHKANAGRRHHIPRPKRRVTNWAEHDAALRWLGSATAAASLRARVESQIGRWKRVIGDGLRFHTDEAQVAEVIIAVEVLNRMLDLGRPNPVRVA